MFGFHNGIPVFLAVPDSIIETRFYEIVVGQMGTEADVAELMSTMWRDQGADFYYYHPVTDGPSVDSPLLAAKNLGLLEMTHRERRYYKHPLGSGYIRIPTLPESHAASAAGDAEDPLAWQHEVVTNGPEFWRVTLKLSSQKTHELDTISKVQMEDRLRKEAEAKRYAYDVFLSYASPNIEQANVVREKLAAAGLRVFMAKKSLKGGDDFAEEIRKALLGSQLVFLLLSPTSLSSEWVTTEWGAAWVLQKRIIPILYQCAPGALPARLGKVHCVDLHDVDGLISDLTGAA
jgi:hypothetical protein